MNAYIGKSENYTVCYAELYGILMATSLTHIIINVEKQPGITSAIIYTDNQAAIQKIKDPNSAKSGQHLVQSIVTMINGLRNTGAKIELHWVPAHVGIAGNEKADREAKRAHRPKNGTKTKSQSSRSRHPIHRATGLRS